MEKSEICPNCGRNLEENEIYCHFCEMDVSELRKKSGNKREKAQNKH